MYITDQGKSKRILALATLSVLYYCFPMQSNKDRLFTRFVEGLDQEGKELYYKSVVFSMEGEAAQQARVEFFRNTLKQVGRDVFIGKNVTIRGEGDVILEDGVFIDDNCTLTAHRGTEIVMREKSRLKHGVYLDTESKDRGYIHIGKEVYIGSGCCLHGHSGLEIGDHSLLAQNITITPFSHGFTDPNRTIYAQKGFTRKVTIGRDCYLGMHVCVVYTADIGEGSVVGAGSVVVKPLPPYSVAVGVPAKVIKKRGPGQTLA